jgi:hypothetical protein
MYVGFARVVLPTKKSVLVEAVEFAKPRHVERQSDVYPLRVAAFLRANLVSNSGNSAS